MCGRFAQAQTGEEYLAYLANDNIATLHMTPNPLVVTTQPWHKGIASERTRRAVSSRPSVLGLCSRLVG